MWADDGHVTLAQHATMEKSDTAHSSNGYSNNSYSNGYYRAAAKDETKQVTYTISYPSLPALILLVTCPIFGLLFVYIIIELKGDPLDLVAMVNREGLAACFEKIILDHILGSRKAWLMIGVFATFELVLMKVLPGNMVKGPVTPKGNVPVYKANGFLSFVVTMITFNGLVLAGLFDPADIYDNFIDMIGGLTLASLVFVLFLYLKGRFAPSSSDNSASGYFLFDYFWGTELYPRILGWDVKMFTNCRFGLMGWGLLVLSYALKQHSLGLLSDSMVVSVGIQLVYVAKFFHWEMGYMKSLDIMHDRAGFMICWGCLVWVPSVYTSHTLYLVEHPVQLGLPLAAAIFAVGISTVFINYQADYQREHVRNTNGKCTIWGRSPDIINATYRTAKGEVKNNILLTSGWWGVARHFHYVPELTAAFCWCVPALFDSPLPYFYFVFLLVLLVHRSIRDDKRCQEKYGKYWTMYCKKVPWKILPYIF